MKPSASSSKSAPKGKSVKATRPSGRNVYAAIRSATKAAPAPGQRKTSRGLTPQAARASATRQVNQRISAATAQARANTPRIGSGNSASSGGRSAGLNPFGMPAQQMADTIINSQRKK